MAAAADHQERRILGPSDKREGGLSLFDDSGYLNRGCARQGSLDCAIKSPARLRLEVLGASRNQPSRILPGHHCFDL
jgi:hypothetical protein